jgi:hypothetical protein
MQSVSFIQVPLQFVTSDAGARVDGCLIQDNGNGAGAALARNPQITPTHGTSAAEMDRWKSIEADGCTWHVRTVTNPDMGTTPGQSVLEFQPEGGTLPARRLVVEDSALQDMDDEKLRRAYLRALPIGGDHYGRPGKRMTDAG